MRPSTAENNAAHYNALAIVEAFEKSGGKIQRLATATRSVAKSTINKRTPRKINND